MGGGHSSIQQVIQDPKPLGPDPSTGLSLSTSEGCGKCELLIDGGISSSMVEMMRMGDPMEYPSTPGAFSTNTRAHIAPTLPFKATFNGVPEAFPMMSVYAPSPIRIESVQHDAVLQIGLEGTNKIIIIVPLVSSALSAPSINFMQKIGSTVQTLAGGSAIVDAPGVTDGSKKVYAKVPVPTGSDWKLTDLIGPTDPYFTWVSAEYESYVRTVNPSFKVMGWRPKDGTRYIVMQNPAAIGENDLAAIRMLPVTKPGDVLGTIGKVFYKSGTPKKCATCKPVIPKPPAFPDISTSTIAAPSLGSGGGGMSVEAILTILGYVVGALAVGVAIFFGVKYAMDNKWASVLPKIGESIQRQMAAAYAKSKTAMAKSAAATSAMPVSAVLPGLAPYQPRNRFLGRRTQRTIPGPVADIAAREPVNLPEPSGEIARPRRFLGRTPRRMPGLANVSLPEPIGEIAARPRRFLGRRTQRTIPGPVADIAAREPVNLPEPSGEIARPRRFLGRTGRKGRTVPAEPRAPRIARGTATRSLVNPPPNDVVANATSQIARAHATMNRVRTNVIPVGERPQGTTTPAQAREAAAVRKAKREAMKNARRGTTA
jgi:hypothetical protein